MEGCAGLFAAVAAQRPKGKQRVRSDEEKMALPLALCFFWLAAIEVCDEGHGD
jgi:hypothetical protein